MFDYLLKPTTLAVARDVEAADSSGQPPTTLPARSTELTLAEALDLIRVPRPAFVPASAFAHLTEPGALALDMLSCFDRLDRSCPEIQALVTSTIGSCYGDILAGRLAPKTHVGKHKAMRHRRPPKGKQPQPASLFTLFPND